LRKKGSVKKCPVSNNTLVFDNILKKQETPFIQEFNSYLHSKRVVFFAHALPVGGRHECVVLRERHVTAGGATVPLKGKGRKTNKEKKINKANKKIKNQKSQNRKKKRKRTIHLFSRPSSPPPPPLSSSVPHLRRVPVQRGNASLVARGGQATAAVVAEMGAEGDAHQGQITEPENQ
jgi:hypothetical protein